MKTRKPVYQDHFHMSVHKEVAISISKSGKTAQEWMREAAQIRLEQENQKDTPLEALKGQMKSLQHYVNELTAEIKTLKNDQAKNHITTMGVDSDLRDLVKQSAFVRQNQIELTHVLNQMDKNFSHAVTQLGPSLLVLLSQQLRDLIQVEIAKAPPKPKPLPPLPPRNL